MSEPLKPNPHYGGYTRDELVTLRGKVLEALSAPKPPTGAPPYKSPRRKPTGTDYGATGMAEPGEPIRLKGTI